MKLIRFGLAVVAVGAVASLAYVAQQIEGAGANQVSAAQAFLASLAPEQKQQATFPFDSKERTNWNFIPLQDNKTKMATRKGLPLEAMNDEQRKKAFELLKSGTSAYGAETAQLIMSLEGILRDVEKGGAMIRNPQWYFVTVFGTPSKTGKWGWRIEGHHLSLNVTLDGAQVVASTPFFFGANPAVVKTGPKAGTKVLGPAQDLASKLFDSLSDEQKSAAKQAKEFPEPGQKEVSPKVGTPVGVSAAKMTPAQRETLNDLLQHYLSRMPADVAEKEWKLAQEAGLDKVHFAFHGSTEPGKGRTYRVQGPTFVVEFLNIQADGQGNPNNHIHSSWRRIQGDFGGN